MTQDSLLEHAEAGLPNPTRRRVALDDVCETELTGAPNAGVSSMERDGQLEAVKLHDRGEGQLLGVADGNRRVANARRLGWTHIDALVYPALSGTQLAHLQLGLHLRAPNLVTEARALGRLMQGGAGTADEDLARESKLSVTRVRKLRKMLSLPGDVLELTGTVLSEGVAEAVANLQGEHRSRAVALIRARASEDRGRFTAQDLKDVQLARNSHLAALLGGVHVATPVVTLSAADLLAAQVRVMCSEAQVSLGDLCLVLARNEAPIPLQVPTTSHLTTPETPAPWEDAQPAPCPDLFGVAAGTQTEKLIQGLFASTSRTRQPDPWDLPPPVGADASPASAAERPADPDLPTSVGELVQAALHGSQQVFTQTANRWAAQEDPVAPAPVSAQKPRGGGASFGVRSYGNVRSRTS